MWCWRVSSLVLTALLASLCRVEAACSGSITSMCSSNSSHTINGSLSLSDTVTVEGTTVVSMYVWVKQHFHHCVQLFKCLVR